MRKVLLLFLFSLSLYSYETIKIYDKYIEDKHIVIPYDNYNLDIKEIFSYVYNNGKIKTGIYPENFDAVKSITFEDKKYKIEVDCFFSVEKFKRQIKIYFKNIDTGESFTLIDNGLNGLFQEDIFLINHITKSYYSKEIKDIVTVTLEFTKK